MSSASSTDVKFEIGHVLFIDIVGYSKLLISEQSTQLEVLKEIVRGTEQFRLAETEGKLLRLPTGDGGALVFRTTSEAPVLCALEIAKALKTHPKLRVRMGIHSGPVSEVADLNEQVNMAGAGVNIAQRVMDCGDAGHILLSKHVAEDLEHFPRWQPQLHDLGECEVKHGDRLHLVNLYTQEVGNPEAPTKFRQAVEKEERAISKPEGKPFAWPRALIAALILLTAAGVGYYFFSQRAGPTTSEKSIAVLPFENLSSDKENTYFTDGIQDEILTRLSKIADLKVISRTSTQKYRSAPDNLREVGKQLGVANLVEGSVQKVANAVHVNVQLIRAATDEHIWAESYNRKLDDVFGVEGEVASAIADQLNAKLTGAEKQQLASKPTDNPQAYDAYLRGLALYRKSGMDSNQKAEPFLEQAVHLDPGFAISWALLARINASEFFNGDDASEKRRAATRAALDTAVRLQPDLAEVQLAQGYYQYYVERDYDGAAGRFKELVAKWPSNAEILEALGLILRRQGHWQDSTAYLDRAVALDPLSLSPRLNAAQLRSFTRDYPTALRDIDDALNISPDDVNFISFKALNYQVQGELDQAEAALADMHVQPTDGTGILAIVNQARLRRNYTAGIKQLEALLQLNQASAPDDFNSCFLNLSVGDLRRLSGDTSGANANYLRAREALLAMLKNQPNNSNAYDLLALVYAGLDDQEEAMKNIDRAVKLLPIAKDALQGAFWETDRARLQARFGDRDGAIPALASLLKIPGYLTPAFLRLDPDFDPLRNDPRFQKLAASEAPRQ